MRITLLFFIMLIFIACSEQKSEPEKQIKEEIATSNIKEENNQTKPNSAEKEKKSKPIKEEGITKRPIPLTDSESMRLANEAINGANGMVRYEAFKKLNFKSYEQRAERGDTLTKSLAWYTQLFPNEISGYKANDIRMEYDSSGIFLFADIKRSFTAKDDREKYVVCELYDYVELPQKNYTENAWVTSIFEIESEMGYIRRIDIDIPHVYGIEDYKRETGLAVAKYNIGYRFTLVVMATKQEDTEFVKQIAEKFDFEKLIKM